MTPFLIVAITAFLAAGLTMYSGFGLGTMLLPVFALFFPVEVAVVATAMVHAATSSAGKYTGVLAWDRTEHGEIPRLIL